MDAAMMISPVPNILPVLSLKPQSPMLDIVIANVEQARAADMLRGFEDEPAVTSTRIVEARAQQPAMLDRRA